MKTKRRRYLRPWVQHLCTVVMFGLGAFFAMLEDFESEAFPLLIGLAAIWVGAIYLLWNYGKGVCTDDEEN